MADLNGLLKLEREAWPKGEGASEEQLKSRINIFPSGVIAAFDNTTLVGAVMAEIVDLGELTRVRHSWAEISGEGLITTHDERGDVLFGVDLSVMPSHRKAGIGKGLLLEIGKMAIRRNLKGGVLGARMPDYHLHHKDISAEEYITKRGDDGKLIDSELRFYERNRLSLIKLIPEYFPDPDSLNYGVLCYWKNPFYLRNRTLGKIIGSFGALIFKL